MNPEPSLSGLLLTHTEAHPEKLLFAFLGRDGRTKESYSYEAFWQRTTDIAAHLTNRYRLSPGERVLLVYPPGLEMMCSFFACVRLGLIPVPVFPPSSHGFASALHRMNFIARDCGAAAVLTDRVYYWSLRLHRVRTQIASRSFERDFSSTLEWIVTNEARPGGRLDRPDRHSDILFLQYTSGSTSEPKGVIVSHDNVLSNCGAVVDHTPTAVSWLPQYHDLGLIGFYLFVAAMGGTTYGFSPLDFIERPALWLQTISRYRATASAAPNFAYEYCLRDDKVGPSDLAGVDLSSLRLLWSGAEPVRATVFQQFREKFEPHGLPPTGYSAAYGLAEYTLAVSGMGRTTAVFDGPGLADNQAARASNGTPPEDTTALVSCGAPLGDTRVKIVDLSGRPSEAPDGRVGEIWVTGPSKCLGYWNRPGLTSEIFEARIDGDPSRASWLRTGDLGFIEDGELYICGRAKDLIIVRGLNYYPQDIERIVEEHPAIRKGCAAAFSVDDGDREVVVVVAELRNARQGAPLEVISREISERLGLVVDHIVGIPPRTIPKTTSGKIARHRARALWLASEVDIVARLDAPTALDAHGTAALEIPGRPDHGHNGSGNETRSSLGQLFRSFGLSGTEDSTLLDAGLDSLRTAEFAQALEDHLGAVGASDLISAVDLRWLQKIAISELFEVLAQVQASAPHAKLRFRQAFAAARHEQAQLERSMMQHDARLGLAPVVLAKSGRVVDRREGGVLLTGGTGFLGPFMLRSLLEQTDDRLHVLVRADTEAHARARLREGLAGIGSPVDASLLDAFERRVQPICGDLSRPRLGLSTTRWTALAQDVHTVFHNGALVNYLMDYATMRDTNVEGTREVVRLATAERTKILNHVSSTFIFGWSTQETLYESDDNDEMSLLDFGYSQTKWVSEQIVLDAMRSGLPGRVFRPALIAPSVDGGGYNFDITIRLLAFMLKYCVGTTARNQVSFSPADLVADNIVAISGLDDTVGRTFHVTRDEYASMQDITAILGEATDRQFVDYELNDFVPVVIGLCEQDDLLFPLLNFLVRSVDNITAMEFKRYENSNYQEARARSRHGRADPPLRDVVMGIVRFLERHGLVPDRAEARTLEQV